jgi:hypothetical protein
MFTQRDVCHDLGLKVEVVAPGLELLEAKGYIRRRPVVLGEQGGRPSVQFDVWPGL